MVKKKETEFEKEIHNRISNPNFDTKQIVPSIEAQIGQHLIKEAFHEAEAKQRGQVVKQVSDIMERLSLMRAVKNKTDRRIELCEKQLQALNAGEFRIIGTGFAGVPGQRIENGIRFTDSSLNVDWSETERW